LNLINAGPFKKVNGFNDPHAKARQVAILTPKQLAPYLAPSAFSGLRREEIARLDWSEIKLDRGLIDLPYAKSKNRRRKLIEIPANLRSWLASFAREAGSVKPRVNVQRASQNTAKAALPGHRTGCGTRSAPTPSPLKGSSGLPPRPTTPWLCSGSITGKWSTRKRQSGTGIFVPKIYSPNQD
jgi:integrase